MKSGGEIILAMERKIKYIAPANVYVEKKKVIDTII